MAELSHYMGKPLPLKKCSDCQYKKLVPVKGWCYMFQTEPDGAYCGAFKGRPDGSHAAGERK